MVHVFLCFPHANLWESPPFLLEGDQRVKVWDSFPLDTELLSWWLCQVEGPLWGLCVFVGGPLIVMEIPDPPRLRVK